MPFPKVLMNWKEPLAFSKLQHPLEPKRNYRPFIYISGIVLGIESVLLLILALAKGLPIPYGLIAASFAVMCMLVIVQSMVDRIVHTNVIMWSNRVGRYSWGTPRRPAYKNLRSYRIKHEPGYRVLELEVIDGKPLLIGVPLDVDLSKLEEILRDHGVLNH